MSVRPIKIIDLPGGRDKKKNPSSTKYEEGVIMSAGMFIAVAVGVGIIIALIVAFRKQDGDSDLSPFMDDGFDGD